MQGKPILVLFLALFVATFVLAPRNGLSAEEKAATPAMKAGAEKAAAGALSGPININTAGPEELAKLPGIGPKTAEEIVNYRKDHGPFKTTRDLINVKGVGDKKFEAIQDKITVGTP